MAVLRRLRVALDRPRVRVALSVAFVSYLAYGPVLFIVQRPGLVPALLAVPVAALTLGCYLLAVSCPAEPRRDGWLLLGSLAGAAAIHAVDPFTSMAFFYALVFAAPFRMRLRWAVLLSLADLAVLAGVSLAIALDPGATLGVTVGLAYCAVLAMLVWQLSMARRQAAELAEARAREAVLSERARLAREVHDILAHTQSAQVVHLEGARLLLKDDGDRALALDRVERAVRLARSSLEETRRALDTLRGDDPPLRERLEQLAAEFRAATGTGCALSVDAAAQAVSAEAGLAVARTAQEALTNVRKHAPGASVSVAVRRLGPWCELEVRDDGGPRPNTPASPPTASPPAASPSPEAPSHASPLTASPLTASPLTASPSAASPLTASPLTASPSVASPSVASPSPEAPSAEASAAGARPGWSRPGGPSSSGPSSFGSSSDAPGPASGGKGYGLIGMRERAELLGGSLRAQADGRGFAVVLRVPA
ncbi:histidine kinase [Nonomuraea sp. NPDC050783]|uniref:ATP-binding protein n=1 Tax=Nonomuraea sp. NPDC050783 TaxID=3154634 RepID=UPI003465311D